VTSERHVIVIGCLQENTEFPVTEYYGAQNINNDKENELLRKEGGKKGSYGEVRTQLAR
jgi:hypothetical protein